MNISIETGRVGGRAPAHEQSSRALATDVVRIFIRTRATVMPPFTSLGPQRLLDYIHRAWTRPVRFDTASQLKAWGLLTARMRPIRAAEPLERWEHEQQEVNGDAQTCL